MQGPPAREELLNRRDGMKGALLHVSRNIGRCNSLCTYSKQALYNQPFTHFILPTSRQDEHYQSHFTDEETEAQKGEVTCLRSCNEKVEILRF